MYSTFQFWQLAPSSSQLQLANIYQAEMPHKRKQNCCCPKSPWHLKQPVQVRARTLQSFTYAERLALWETNLPWSHFCTIHHLICAKYRLVTAADPNQNISYLKTQTHLSLSKGKSFQMVQLSRQISFWSSSSHLDSAVLSTDAYKKSQEMQ